jgi:hypothetical protein
MNKILRNDMLRLATKVEAHLTSKGETKGGQNEFVSGYHLLTS